MSIHWRIRTLPIVNKKLLSKPSFKGLSIVVSLSVVLTGCSFLPKEEPVLAPPLVEPAEMDYETVEVTKGDLIKKDRKSTRLNSSHVKISYAVFCLKKKKKKKIT